LKARRLRYLQVRFSSFGRVASLDPDGSTLSNVLVAETRGKVAPGPAGTVGRSARNFESASRGLDVSGFSRESRSVPIRWKPSGSSLTVTRSIVASQLPLFCIHTEAACQSSSFVVSLSAVRHVATDADLHLYEYRKLRMVGDTRTTLRNLPTLRETIFLYIMNDHCKQVPCAFLTRRCTPRRRVCQPSPSPADFRLGFSPQIDNEEERLTGLERTSRRCDSKT
jgi:hypothetical protein